MLLELSLHAQKLQNVAGMLKGTSDPFAIVTKLATDESQQPVVIGRTEVIKNTLNPEWVKVFVFNYELGTPTKIAVTIMDEIRKGENKTMGSAVFEIGEVLGTHGNTQAKRLKGNGTVYANIRPSQGSGLLRLGMKGVNLKNTEGFLRKSDPFFELCRKVNNAGAATWDNVFRSDVVMNNLSPVWKETVIDLSILCAGDLDLPVQVKVFDHEGSGKHVLMGEFETSVRGLQAAVGGSGFTLKIKGKETGKISVIKAEVSGVNPSPDKSTSPEPSAPIEQKMANVSVSGPPPVAPRPIGRSFADYISGGCELNVVVAIDFTGSNGDPRLPGTLHYFSANGVLNDYERSIRAVVSILEGYDTDRMFPVLGFGAKYEGVVRHAFQVGPYKEVHGAKGVLDAYHSTFSSGLTMSGPTYFHEVMETAAARAESLQEAAKRQGRQAYTILLILTDGAVSDVQATVACINRISNAPLSIVIVGIGNADFSAMRFLDDMNDGPGKRDIVQFLSFREHCHSSQALTSATLNEIPRQLESYFQSRGINPLPPVKRSDVDIVVGEEENEIDLSLDVKENEIIVTGGGTAYTPW